MFQNPRMNRLLSMVLEAKLTPAKEHIGVEVPNRVRQELGVGTRGRVVPNSEGGEVVMAPNSYDLTVKYARPHMESMLPAVEDYQAGLPFKMPFNLSIGPVPDEKVTYGGTMDQERNIIQWLIRTKGHLQFLNPSEFVMSVALTLQKNMTIVCSHRYLEKYEREAQKYRGIGCEITVQTEATGPYYTGSLATIGREGVWYGLQTSPYASCVHGRQRSEAGMSYQYTRNGRPQISMFELNPDYYRYSTRCLKGLETTTEYFLITSERQEWVEIGTGREMCYASQRRSGPSHDLFSLSQAYGPYLYTWEGTVPRIHNRFICRGRLVHFGDEVCEGVVEDGRIERVLNLTTMEWLEVRYARGVLQIPEGQAPEAQFATFFHRYHFSQRLVSRAYGTLIRPIKGPREASADEEQGDYGTGLSTDFQYVMTRLEERRKLPLSEVSQAVGEMMIETAQALVDDENIVLMPDFVVTYHKTRMKIPLGSALKEARNGPVALCRSRDLDELRPLLESTGYLYEEYFRSVKPDREKVQIYFLRCPIRTWGLIVRARRLEQIIEQD